jgi:hypothetical protein
MSTARDLITLALKDAGIVGVGQPPAAEDINDGLTRLNSMIAQWSQRRWLVYHLVDVVFQATGALSYSLGIGGDIPTTRAAQIEAAFFRQIAGVPGSLVDYPLDVLYAREEYNRIALKAMSGFPSILFYDSGWPLGNVFLWPVPSNLYEIHLSIKATLQTFANLTDSFNFPPEYEEAMRLNLSVRFRVAYQLGPDAGLNGLAKVALNTIKNANAQIPTLQLPRFLVGANRPYNIYSDNN